MAKNTQDTSNYLLQSAANKERLFKSIAQVNGQSTTTSPDARLVEPPVSFTHPQNNDNFAKKQEFVKLVAKLINLKDIQVDPTSIELTDDGFVWAACQINVYSSPLTEESITNTLTEAGLKDWKWEWTPTGEIYLTSLKSYLW